MPSNRTRLVALTCAVAATTASVSSVAGTPAAGAPLPSTAATATYAAPTALPGLSRLVAAGPKIRTGDRHLRRGAHRRRGRGRSARSASRSSR